MMPYSSFLPPGAWEEYAPLIFAWPESTALVLSCLLLVVWSRIYLAYPPSSEEMAGMRALSLHEQHLALSRGSLGWLNALRTPPPPPPGTRQIAKVLGLNRGSAVAGGDGTGRSLSRGGSGGGGGERGKEHHQEMTPGRGYQWRPSRRQQGRRKMTLVLDLDETLVHACTKLESNERNKGGVYLDYDEVITIQVSGATSGGAGEGSGGGGGAIERSGGKGGTPSPRRRWGHGKATGAAAAAAAAAETPSPRSGGGGLGGDGGTPMNSNTSKTIYLWKRPYLSLFLREASKLYEIVIYTAGLRRYADQVINRIDLDGVVRHRFFRDSCIETSRKGEYQKDIFRCTKDDAREHYPERVVIIDDKPVVYNETCPDNAIPIKPYYGTDPDDDELLKLLPFLNALSAVNDVRSVLQLRRTKGLTKKDYPESFPDDWKPFLW